MPPRTKVPELDLAPQSQWLAAKLRPTSCYRSILQLKFESSTSSPLENVELIDEGANACRGFLSSVRYQKTDLHVTRFPKYCLSIFAQCDYTDFWIFMPLAFLRPKQLPHNFKQLDDLSASSKLLIITLHLPSVRSSVMSSIST